MLRRKEKQIGNLFSGRDAAYCAKRMNHFALGVHPPVETKENAQDDHEVDDKTEMAHWFVAGLPRSQVRKLGKLLKKKPAGAFLVRSAKRHDGPYALTVVINKKIVNYLIKRGSKGFIVEAATGKAGRGTAGAVSADSIFELITKLASPSQTLLPHRLLPDIVVGREKRDLAADPFRVNSQEFTNAYDQFRVGGGGNAIVRQIRKSPR